MFSQLNSYKDIPQQESAPTANENPQINKIQLSGKMLLLLIDFVFPLLSLKIVSMFDSRAQKIKVSEIKLTKEEKTELEPFADEVSKYLTEYINPLYALPILLTITYSGKIMIALENVKK